MTHYLISYSPPRESFPGDATPSETSAVDDHFEYLKRLHAEGILILAGRTEDASVGIFIFSAEDNSQANQIAENDPAVKAGVFSATVKQFRIALLAG